MSGCLRPDEIVDALDGTLPRGRRAHLEGCATCRETLDAAEEAMREARSDAVPEPSPYFWPSINARVRAAIGDEAPAAHQHSWWRWPAWVPALALAGVVLALMAAVGGRRTGVETELADGLDVIPAATSTLGEPLDDPALALVVELASQIDDDADPLALQPLGDFGELAARTLSADEQDALRTLLATAVDRPSS